MTDKLQIPDGDHELSEGRTWIKVGPYAVAIIKTDEGIAVDIYQDGREMEEAVSSCWALDADLADPEGEIAT